MAASKLPRLDKDRHVKYWKRCLKTYLPTQYTSNDSNRMYLAYFMISAFEMLDILKTSISEDERQGYIDWIYHCQHPHGGFRMWPGTDFGDRASETNAAWDPGNVPATYFALTTLITLGDDLRRVHHVATLRWLKGMQRPDGSFAEVLVNGQLSGGRDPRLGYCAAASRDILRRLCSSAELEQAEDIDTAALARHAVSGQSFDGGFADAIAHEPQAGYTFCVLGTLDLLGLLGGPGGPDYDRDAVIKWLVDRQTDCVDPDDEDEEDNLLDVSKYAQGLVISDMQQAASPPTDILHAKEVNAAGMNGRPNKIADTCYAWWVEASLHMLGHSYLYHKPAVRSYLLTLTQHPYMGGFTKIPDEKHADIYHSFMGLAALSLASTEEQRQADGITSWDPTMCVSTRVRNIINTTSCKAG